MARGAFITIEGGEGVGKTTSLEAIETFLRRRGMPITVTREPGGTMDKADLAGYLRRLGTAPT
jgi:dTMP kinase